MIGTNCNVGSTYEKALTNQNVVPRLYKSRNPTKSAQCLSMITPDGQRTMRTFLGAACELSYDDFTKDWLSKVDLLAGSASLTLMVSNPSCYRRATSQVYALMWCVLLTICPLPATTDRQPPACIRTTQDARHFHVEGYCLYRPELAKSAFRHAHQPGTRTSLDLASYETVRNCQVCSALWLMLHEKTCHVAPDVW